MAPDTIPFVIWGSGGTARKLFDVVTLNGGKIVAIFDRNPQVKSVLEGVPIYYGEEGLREWLSEPARKMPCNALVGAGASPGYERIELLNLFTRYGFLTPSAIHPTAYVSPAAEIRRGCALFTNAIVDTHSVVGEACLVNDAARVGHDCVVGSGVHLAPGAILLGGSAIGDNVVIGANAVVLPGISVGANSKVGAGAVVVSSLPANVTAVGNPAKIAKN